MLLSTLHLRNFALLSILAGVATFALKSAAYYLTDSVGMFSDAAESIINLLAAVTAFFSLWYASLPVDSSHTYGHEKIEYFSSGLEGMLVLIAAGGTAWYAVQRLIHPRELQELDLGLVISLSASLINLAVAQILLRVGKKRQSIVLEADGQHLMTDVWTSAAVIIGLLLVRITDLQYLDPIVALVITAHISWTGLDLMIRSFNGLMDHALPVEEQNRVRAAIEGLLKPGMAYHALRTRQAGARRFVDFHLLVPGNLTVRNAHALGNLIERAVRNALPHAEVTVHVEPIEEKASWEDSELLSVEQAARREQNAENKTKPAATEKESPPSK